MIAFVRGPVVAVNPDSAVVEVGGVGILVMCAPATLAGLRVGTEATLATSMVVREDSLTLFGFPDSDERSVFELLQTASGVGPKVAQAMLAVHGPDELRRAITSEDLAALCAVPGIGRKGAQRVVLELKDRIGAPVGTNLGQRARNPSADDVWRDQVRAGLLGLGWSTKEAESAVESIATTAHEAAAAGEPMSVAQLLRAALRSLSRA
ncbi:MAG: Holliday junction branch migration protein RuvA [Propionibacteriales bacterium]|nr:Holliday junction branch migration protein RuvA [Propionibacteriales bacterium]